MAWELLVLNKGEAPTFVTRVRLEVVVLTVCSLVLQRLIRGWCVVHEPSLLEHRYILYRIDIPRDTLKSICNPKKIQTGVNPEVNWGTN